MLQSKFPFKDLASLTGVCLLLISFSAEAEENGGTRMILAGPVKFRKLSVLNRYQKDTWKVNYEEYRYRRFHPMLHEKYPYVSPRLPELGGTYTFPLRGKDRFSGKRTIFRCRLFPVNAKATKASSVKVLGKEISTPDWQGFDCVRVDVKTVADQFIWWGIIDEKIQPPIVGNFKVSGGSWHTLEIDLTQAVKERKLNLGRMHSMWMYAEPTAGGELRAFRLVKRFASTKHPILRDPKATKLPDFSTTEARVSPDIRPDLTPLSTPKTLTFEAAWAARVSKTDRRGHNSGAVTIFDHRNVCIIHTLHNAFTRHYPAATAPGYKYVPTSEFYAVQTTDGGTTWTGINGEKKPTHLIIDRATYFKPIDAHGDIIEWNQNGCQSGPAGPWHRLRKYTFLGSKGWRRWKQDRVLDEEARHCTHGSMDFVRTQDGRIWGALGIEGRWYPEVANVHAKVSDTDGKHWITWRPGFTSRISGMSGQHPVAIVPYKKHVAIVSRSPAACVWYDGREWSKPVKLPTKYIRNAATCGKNNDELLVATYAAPGVLRWDGQAWKTELKACVSLCKSGTTLIGFALGKKDLLNVYQRSAEGKWEGPATIQLEPVVDHYVPRFCPANLGAFVYVPKNNPNTIKVLMVPNNNWRER